MSLKYSALWSIIFLRGSANVYGREDFAFVFDVTNAYIITLLGMIAFVCLFVNLHLVIGSESLINVKFYLIKNINLYELLPIPPEGM